jgi:hypothetical protein
MLFWAIWVFSQGHLERIPSDTLYASEMECEAALKGFGKPVGSIYMCWPVPTAPQETN